MKTKKMSLANIQGKLSRNEMKQIMAGSGCGTITCSSTCVLNTNCASACTNTGYAITCGGNYYTNAEICKQFC